MMNIPYSSCCRCRNGCMWRRNSLKCLSRSLYGITMATFCLDVQYGGEYLPPGDTLCANNFTTVSIFTSVVFTNKRPVIKYTSRAVYIIEAKNKNVVLDVH